MKTPLLKPAGRLQGWILITLVALAAYLPTLRNGFVWDDDTFLTDNALIKAPDGLRRFWLTTEPPDYWPVTSTTLWAEWRLWGRNATGYHVTNLLLHIAEAGLLWGILRRLRAPGALFAALLFAAHPVNVESVAWIAQRKNLMAMLFALGTVWFFLDAEERPQSRRAYALSLGAFLLALLSKGSVATLPLVLLGIIAWRRRPARRDLLRLAPFLGLAAALAGVNVWFAHHTTSEIVRHAGPLERLLGAGAVVWFYLGKALWPFPLIFVYPQWRISAGDALWYVPLAAALAATVLLFRWRRKSPFARAALYAWLYFGVMLVPVMGFTDVYFMKYSLVADHYQHLALIGVVALAAAAWAAFLGERARLPVAAAVIALLAALTWRQASTYRDSETLYRSILARNPDAWIAHNNLVNILNSGEHPRLPEAVEQLREALRLRPQDARNWNNLGVALVRLDRPAEAAAPYREAVRLQPDSVEFNYNLGLDLRQIGRSGEAIPYFQNVVQLRPRFAQGHIALALALWDAGRRQEAVAERNKATALQPMMPDFSGYGR